MRASILSLAACLVAVTAPALSQGLPSANLNSINNSLAAMGQASAFQQQQTSNFNTLRMDGQRNVQFQPQDGYAAPVILRQGRGFGASGPRHNGGVRAGRTGVDTGLDRGICIGC
ncbi:hypothetical protein [Methylobacterium planeticum]|uniref:Curlin n=1 Tax=Methylobacterium planeticum TaxID=2615211 RepID=A0A6N6MSD7_9HYPH|nr:hypothetical protein [Methylobacterium planeticum]KAB1073191.1 hypothetical protein F6X51_12645 [Methylobacterium planeticum]